MHATTHSSPCSRLDLRDSAGRESTRQTGPRPAEPAGDADQLGLAVDGPLAGVGVGVGEVGRAAEHRHREPGRADRLADAVEVAVVEAGEEAVVHLQAVGVERPGHLDPVEDRHRPVAGDLVEVALGEGGDLQRHGRTLLARIINRPIGTNFTQTGFGTSADWPVGSERPDCGSIRKTTTVPESWFAARR